MYLGFLPVAKACPLLQNTEDYFLLAEGPFVVSSSDNRRAMKYLLLVSPLSFMVCVTVAGAAPPSLSYRAPHEKVHYDVKITFETPGQRTLYQGRIAYEGSESGGKLTFNFQGGLKESVESKRGAKPAAADPFGGLRPPAPPPSPFAQPTSPGALRQTTAKIALSPTGEVLSLEGNSQIPLPLGHLSVLVFEPLPDTPKDEWSATNGVLLGRPAKPSGGFPGDPFAKPAQPGKTSAGSQSSRYVLKESEGNKVTIQKQYELQSPNTDPAFEIAGSGSLVFDRQLGVFVSADLKYELKAGRDGVKLTLPVSVEYRLVPAAEIKRETAERALADLERKRKDAAGGCDGIKDGHYGFHTEKEQDPWWQIDLGDTVALSGVVIYNRCNDKDMEKRADRIRVLLSEDGKSWTQEYEHKGPSFFGHSDQKPLKVPLAGKTARYVRLQIPVYDYFHLDEVEVYEKGNSKNIAVGKPAEQSSVDMRYSNF